jgi:hypothetical protein
MINLETISAISYESSMTCSLGAVNMAGLSRFVPLLSESAFRILHESNDDMLCND